MRFLLLICLFFTTSLSAVSPVKAVVFDFGEVIAQKGDISLFYRFISEQLKLSKEETKALMTSYKAALNGGALPEEFWRNWSKTNNIVLPDCWSDKFDKQVASMIATIPGMPEIVKELGKLGFRTPLLSNIDRVHAHFIRRTGLYNMFCPLLLSYELGVEKPDPHIYRILLTVLDLPASAVIFIDDKLPNVEEARKLGIDGIQFQSPEQLKMELAKRGIILKSA